MGTNPELSNVLALTLFSWLFFKLRPSSIAYRPKKYGVRHPVLGRISGHSRLNEPNPALKRNRRRSAALLKFHIKALMSPRLLAAIRLLMLPAFALANFIAYISSLEFFATFMSIPEDKPLIYGALLVKGFAAAALVCNPLKPTEVTPSESVIYGSEVKREAQSVAPRRPTPTARKSEELPCLVSPYRWVSLCLRFSR